jgi:EAL domain-containing protein (putative c-di-GMP-specific phosphodiesterase class I)
VSAQDIGDLAFIKTVSRALQRAGVDARRLIIELTESSLVRKEQHARVVLRELRALGVRVSLDDFGTGYSSLALLEHLPVTELKIDRSFLRDQASVADNPILRCIVRLGHELGLTVVAEGVERESALRAVRRLGCDQAQG